GTTLAANMAPWRLRLYYILNNRKDYIVGRLLNLFFIAVLLISIATLCISTVPSVIDDPKTREALFWVDTVSILVFTVELVLNCIVAPTWRDMINFMYFIDLAAILPYYIELLINLATSINIIDRGVEGVDGVGAIRVLRLFRIFRIFKAFQKSSKLRVIGKAIKDSRDGIAVLLFTISLLVVFYSTLIYYAEQTGSYYRNGTWYYNDDNTPSQFQSIPGSFFVMIVTLTVRLILILFILFLLKFQS
ncbi:hypothetical protein HK102_008520, partial [Quaeritorhiza haematococci]